MKCVMVMFDSLNRRCLPPYGHQAWSWVQAPNFQRLANRSVTFDNSYVCSMPCMPARRDLHTGRPNFLHRGWGPLEPFDDSMPELLKRAGVHTHLVTDHQHYWEDGGATYHQRYSTFEFIRGQEGDKWKGLVGGVPPAANAFGRNARGSHSDQLEFQDRVNRRFMPEPDDHPQARTFAAGLEFIEQNKDADRWLLQLETFDPHEPFFTHERDKAVYAEHYEAWRKNDGRLWDWPDYEPVQDEHTTELIEHMRHEYASLVSLCDRKLGEVLDAFDRHDLWHDTMLVVWTDHGFLLGEHDWWAKLRMPWWDELAHTPFFVYDPRCRKQGERRQALVQPAIDLAPTLLEFFGLQPTPDMTGKVLRDTIADDTPVRDTAMFGVYGSEVNVTDGRYVYMHALDGRSRGPLYEYTLMPTHMKSLFAPDELTSDKVEMHPGFRFTKRCVVMRVLRSQPGADTDQPPRSRLYDLATDPEQQHAVDDETVQLRMTEHLVRLMHEIDAPTEQYRRLGLPHVAEATLK
jgi:arylsulfatase A-like enzyme